MAKKKHHTDKYYGGGTIDSIWHRDKKTCWICRHGVSRADASRDHVKPRSLGGYDKSKNYRLTHKRCNVARDRLTEDEVLKAVGQIGEKPSMEQVIIALGIANKLARSRTMT